MKERSLYERKEVFRRYELDNKYIDEALNYKKKVKKPIWIKWGAMVASLLLVFTMSVPALAAADFGPAYNLLYKVSPAIAQKLKPVSMSCEDNGIKFEVISAYVEGSEAKYKILTEIELMKRQICLIALVSIHLLIVAVRVKI